MCCLKRKRRNQGKLLHTGEWRVQSWNFSPNLCGTSGTESKLSHLVFVFILIKLDFVLLIGICWQSNCICVILAGIDVQTETLS